MDWLIILNTTEPDIIKGTIEHLNEKYGPDGYLKVWIPWSDNAKNLKRLHVLLTDKTRLDDIFNRIFDEETAPTE